MGQPGQFNLDFFQLGMALIELAGWRQPQRQRPHTQAFSLEPLYSIRRNHDRRHATLSGAWRLGHGGLCQNLVTCPQNACGGYGPAGSS